MRQLLQLFADAKSWKIHSPDSGRYKILVQGYDHSENTLKEDEVPLEQKKCYLLGGTVQICIQKWNKVMHWLLDAKKFRML